MGGLRKYMPITYVTMVIGALALCGIPPFAGFFSKDAIIEAVHLSKIPGQGYAYFAVVAGVFVTAFYTFRMIFMTFHGQPRFDTASKPAHGAAQSVSVSRRSAHCSGRQGPAIPGASLACAGWIGIEPLLFGDYFGNSIVVLQQHAVLAEMREEWHGVVAFIVHGVQGLPFWLAIAGIVMTWYLYLVKPALPDRIKAALGPVYTLLENKYYADIFNDWFFAGGARRVGNLFSNIGDRVVIEGIVNGSARVIGRCSALLRRIQSGYVHHYAFTMIIGLFALLIWWVPR
jgi:NADH-quinone oxidoreductase subunit L